eukprot:s2110_g19.t1
MLAKEDFDFVTNFTLLKNNMTFGKRYITCSFIHLRGCASGVMVSLESKPAWEARARVIGVPDGFIQELRASDLCTFGQWAFCCTADPHGTDDSSLKEAVQTLINRDLTPQEMLLCRRLFFEGRTYAISDMQARIDRGSDDKPRVMPLAERMSRIERQKAALVGVTWTAELEPAHKLVDRVMSMQEDGTLVFIPPQKCVSRIQEIHQEKHEVALTFDSAGSIKMGKRAEELKCDTNGDINLRNAWTRRNLAFDQAGLASFVVLEKWTTKLMLAKLKEPPSGFRYISTQQICECDKEMWMLLSQQSRGQLQSFDPDIYPLDALIEQLTTSPEVLCFLSPLPGGKREGAETPSTPAPKKPKPNSDASGSNAGGNQQPKQTPSAPSGVPTFTIDLSNPDEVKVAEQLLRFSRPKAVHFGLMCGTCSRARERSLAPSLKRQGAPEPMPLRDADNLFGRPNLRPLDQLKVNQANLIYSHAIQLLRVCCELNCIVTIENPARSWLWPLLVLLVKQTEDPAFITWYFALTSTMFDACMHGSLRNKSTTILGTAGVFDSLAVRCDGNHDHLPWSASRTADNGWVFDTAAEAEYPSLLSQRLAACILRHVPPEQLNVTLNAMRLSSLQVQGRQHKTMQQLIPDFCTFFWTDGDYKPKSNEKILPPKSAGEENEVANMQSMRVDNEVAMQSVRADNIDDKVNNVKVGVFMEPEQHMQQALQLWHPMDSSASLPDSLKRAAFKMLTMEPHELAAERLEMLKLYRQRAEQLHDAEIKLHHSLPHHVQQVVSGKRLLLLEERLNATSFPDLQVMEDFKSGVDLVGEEPFSPLYLEKLQPASMTVEQLEFSARWSRKLTLAKPFTEHEKEHADRLIELSEEEVAEGFLSGPFFSEEEVSKHLGTDDWTLTKRFLLLQGEDLKERVIDDYKRSMVNAAYASRSYLELQDIDVLSALVTFIMQLLSKGGKVTVELSDGTQLVGQLSKTVRSGKGFAGRCFDLSKAYKQIAVSEKSLKHAVLGARNGKGQWRMYTSQSLPFGAIASVYSFNKSAKALQHLLLEDFAIVTTNYFDDYPTLDLGVSGEITTGVVSQFFQIIGWRHAVTGKKAKPFDSTFGALGVEFNLKLLNQGMFTVGNKPERLQRILRMVTKVSDSGRVSPAEAASIHGLLNFASGFTLGKSLQISAQGFSMLASGLALSPGHLRDLCEHASIILESLQPRQVELPIQPTPVVIYTDGAFDESGGTWGAIVIDPVSGLRLCYAGTVPDFLLDAWRGSFSTPVEWSSGQLHEPRHRRERPSEAWANDRSLRGRVDLRNGIRTCCAEENHAQGEKEEKGRQLIFRRKRGERGGKHRIPAEKKTWLGSGIGEDKRKKTNPEEVHTRRKSKRIAMIERKKSNRVQASTSQLAEEAVLQAAAGSGDPLHGLLALQLAQSLKNDKKGKGGRRSRVKSSSSSDSSSESSSDQMDKSLRGHSRAVHNYQRSGKKMFEDPVRHVRKFIRGLEDELGAKDRPFRVVDYNRRIQWGKQRNLQRCHYLVSVVMENLLREEPERAALQCALTLQALHQAALDNGDWQVAWLLTHVEDPFQKAVRRHPREPSARHKLFADHGGTCQDHRESPQKRLQQRRSRGGREGQGRQGQKKRSSKEGEVPVRDLRGVERIDHRADDLSSPFCNILRCLEDSKGSFGRFWKLIKSSNLQRRPFNELERRLICARLPHGSLLTQLIVPKGCSIRGESASPVLSSVSVSHGADVTPGDPSIPMQKGDDNSALPSVMLVQAHDAMVSQTGDDAHSRPSDNQGLECTDPCPVSCHRVPCRDVSFDPLSMSESHDVTDMPSNHSMPNQSDFDNQTFQDAKAHPCCH